jgi:hypothetical protein
MPTRQACPPRTNWRIGPLGPGSTRSTSPPRLGDFNDDLRAIGRDALRAHLRPQLAPEDAVTFLDHADD